MTTEPGYWMHETSGVLRPAIEAYLKGEALSADDIATIRAYLRQWIMATVWDENPYANADDRAALDQLRLRLDGLTCRAAINRWLNDAIEQGMDPL